MKKKLLLILSICMINIASYAQIGYQVSLLNSATGEPRAAETVQVNITLTNSEGKTIHTETKTATTNDFGILSLAVGNENTFKDVDWRKLPFFIEASVDGKLIGKSQVLTVPIAEHAKHTGTLTTELLCSKTWEGRRYDGNCYYDKYYLNFNNNNFFLTRTSYFINGKGEENKEGYDEYNGTYIVEDNKVICTYNYCGVKHGFIFQFTNNALYSFDGFRSFILK